MKSKHRKGVIYILVGIFICSLCFGIVRYLYVNPLVQTYFRSLPLRSQQRVIRGIGVYVSPFTARSFLYWLKLPTDVMHDIVPVLGESAYISQGVRGFEVCNEEWVIPCYQGVMMGATQQHGYTPKIIRDVANSCTENSLVDGRDALCAQAAGYTILWLNTYWYIESLQFCDRTFMDIPLRHHCWVGVSHENVHRAGDSLRGLYDAPWTTDNMYYPCDSIPLEYQPACVSEQVKVIKMREFGGDTQKTKDYCMYFTHQETQKACMSALDVQN
ncbi:hypothetical protein KBC80_01860 [Candidatus Woesebacteria bacterium]|nr:hypothetical protein [Candidatus Woesebacteria bacterium]